MDLSIPGSTTNSPLSTPSVFGDNVQDLLGTSALHVNPSAIITVNSIADTVDDNDGVTTLREAINQANADDGEDLIVFERSVFSNPQTITLSGRELDITHNLDIIAPCDPLTGANLVEVSGNKASRVFEIDTGATVSLDGLIIADGQLRGVYGGGIKNSGTLTLDNSIIRNNSVISANRYDVYPSNRRMGGGIYNLGTLTLNRSIVSNNSLEIRNSFVSGGGIYNTGTLEVNNSTISSNSAYAGGGIYNLGTVNVNNSTISGNTAVGGSVSGYGSGGGIYNNGILNLVFTTITRNQSFNGAGVFNNAKSSAIVRNTIIAANLNGNSGNIVGTNPDVSGTYTSYGYNLIGDSTGSKGFDATRDIVGTGDNPIDPRLAPLDFNGGSTQTLALLPDSPAIDAGDPTVLDTDPTTDQRGLPRVVNVRADIGAFEVQV